jgi:hypothetical protein
VYLPYLERDSGAVFRATPTHSEGTPTPLSGICVNQC